MSHIEQAEYKQRKRYLTGEEVVAVLSRKPFRESVKIESQDSST